MAIRKTGSRRLVVDGVHYRWRIRRRATYSQIGFGSGTLNVAVERSESPGNVLVILTDRPHPADWGDRRIVPIRPSDIVVWIREALVAGWEPSQRGPPFTHRPISVTSNLTFANKKA